MNRMLGAVVACACLASSAPAMLTSPKSLARGLDRGLVRMANPVTPAPADPATDFRLAPDTQVLLDGKPCKFRDVPPSAKIVRIEVTPDGQTVLRIEFRSAR